MLLILSNSFSFTNIPTSLKKAYPWKNVLLSIVGNAKILPFGVIPKGQKVFVLLDATQAYGVRGYGKMVGPNESLFYNLNVTDIKEN